MHNSGSDPISSADDGKSTKPDQKLVAAGEEEDHQPHPKTIEHPTSPMDDGTPYKPVIPTVSIKSRHDDGPISSKPLPEFNPDDLIEFNPDDLIVRTSYYPLETMGRG